jgi:hypothetical protein
LPSPSKVALDCQIYFLVVVLDGVFIDHVYAVIVGVIPVTTLDEMFNEPPVGRPTLVVSDSAMVNTNTVLPALSPLILDTFQEPHTLSCILEVAIQIEVSLPSSLHPLFLALANQVGSILSAPFLLKPTGIEASASAEFLNILEE